MKAVILCLLACLAWTPDMHAKNPATAPAPAEAQVLQGSWKIVQHAGASNPAQTLVVDSVRKHISGHGGINHYSGNYRQQGDKLHIGSLTTTEMGASQQRMEEERLFFSMLEKVDAWRITNGRLELLQNGKVVAVFVKAA